jgi:hypothetical protein
MTLKCFKLKDPVYDNAIWFVYNCTHEEFNDWCASKFKISILDDEEKPTAGLCRELICKNGIAYAIWIKYIVEDIYAMGLVVHELFHMVIMVMRNIGMELNGGSEEAFSYYFEYLYKQILGGIDYED